MRAAILIATLLMGGVCATGTTLEQLSVDQMIRQATMIVRGRVVATSAVQRGNLIYTNHRIQISEVLKGENQQVVEVSVPGGQSGGLRQTIPGAPTLVAGREYLVLIWRGSRGVNHIIGLSQGLFDVQRNASGEIVLKRMVTDARMLNEQGEEVKDVGVQMTMTSFRDKMRKGERK
jgi:hypothetical protein